MTAPTHSDRKMPNDAAESSTAYGMPHPAVCCGTTDLAEPHIIRGACTCTCTDCTDTEGYCICSMCPTSHCLDERRPTTNGGTMYDGLTDAAAEIAQKVDFMVRSGHGAEAQFHRCRNAAGQLAGTVYAFVEDPEGVGTDALRKAWETYMTQDSGNFGSDPEVAAGAIA